MLSVSPLPVRFAWGEDFCSADGLLRLEDHVLVLEYRVRDIIGNPEGPTRELALPLVEVEALEWRRGPLGGLFRSHVILRVRHLRVLEGLPGGEEGRLRFRVRRADREEAREFASQARLALSGLWLRELEGE